MVPGHEEDVAESPREVAKRLDKRLFVVAHVARDDQRVAAEFFLCQTLDPLEVLRVVRVDVRDGEDLHGGAAEGSSGLVGGFVAVGVGVGVGVGAGAAADSSGLVEGFVGVKDRG